MVILAWIATAGLSHCPVLAGKFVPLATGRSGLWPRAVRRIHGVNRDRPLLVPTLRVGMQSGRSASRLSQRKLDAERGYELLL